MRCSLAAAAIALRGALKLKKFPIFTPKPILRVSSSMALAGGLGNAVISGRPTICCSKK